LTLTVRQTCQGSTRIKPPNAPILRTIRGHLQNIRYNHGVARRPKQLGLFVETEKPRRGRPPKNGAGMSHRARAAVSPERPHHVTVRMRRGTWNLRSQRCFGRIRSALEGVRSRGSFRVVHYSVQGNHVHLIVEGANRRALSNGMRALLIRIAKQLNIEMRARGSRFEDRYHETVLGSPTQVRNALKYVFGNHAHHVGGAVVDPYSSGPWFGGWSAAVAMPRWLPCGGASPPISRPESWLLKSGWKKAGGEL
jgi:REP element-mobilizing transposase RayT